MLESRGLATTQISLIRPHTEALRPPRALWVPFELGRPFGAPNNPEFQTRVLIAVLQLLESHHVPLLVDFLDDAPAVTEGAEQEEWACPVSFKPPPPELQGEPGKLRQSLLREIAQLRPWFELSVERRGRTTVGVSRLEMDDIARFITAFVAGTTPKKPHDDMTLGESLKHACEDLRAFYFEAVTAQPGRGTGSSQQVADWFWNTTTAGAVLRKLEPVCAASDDVVMQHMASYLLLPRSETQSVGDGSDGRVNPEFVSRANRPTHG